jgi:hypothetical protein
MTEQRDTLQRLLRTADQATATDAAELVDEARLEARKKVSAVLADAFAENLLDLVEVELQRRCSELAAAPRRSSAPDSRHEDLASKDADGRATTPASPAPEREEPKSVGCYLYGVVGPEATLAPGLMGLDDVHEVFLVHGESAAAVASSVALEEFGEEALQEHLDDLSWLERHARRHEQILDRVREQTTLVPMRLCTIYRTERAVREMLVREHAFLTDALRRLEGRTEWGVKIYAVSEPREASSPDAVKDHAPDEAAGPGASYLMEKRLRDSRRARAEAVVGERCEMAHSELAQVAVEAKLNPVQPRELTGRDEPMVFNGVYLVDDATLESFSSTVGTLESDLAEDGLEVELTGPWTPYNFVNSPMEVGR